MVNYKNIFNNLRKYSTDIICVINILFVIDGIRPAFWYDCWDINSNKMNKLLKYLDKFSKNGLKYKFNDGNEGRNIIIDNNNQVREHQVREHEGPLIYNTNKLNKKLIKVIENKNIKNIYHISIFGEILGYNCPLNILKIKNKKKYNVISFNFKYNVSGNQYRMRQLYVFYCLKKNLKNIIKNITKKAHNMSKIVKKINNNNSIILGIEY